MYVCTISVPPPSLDMSNPVLPCCALCGTPFPPRNSTKGGRPGQYCPAPKGESHSRCARIAARTQELRQLAASLIEELKPDVEGEIPEDIRASFQNIKSFIWSEMNTATNYGKLVKRRDIAARKVVPARPALVVVRVERECA